MEMMTHSCLSLPWKGILVECTNAAYSRINIHLSALSHQNCSEQRWKRSNGTLSLCPSQSGLFPYNKLTRLCQFSFLDVSRNPLHPGGNYSLDQQVLLSRAEVFSDIQPKFHPITPISDAEFFSCHGP
ncbi:hypothetical protein KIL84_016361 [Mauremys mutica]|uniref:Uncharacterized protein n=1 Tax=Mauremys mutica TaxID=74926 RepID=A0A9D3X2P8_9SAUR|nr:hypothetical protein KIL84_016361 [Mauremys mutica]